MKILMVSSEAVPLAKSGGLADVTTSLSQALSVLGHDVRILIPRYASIKLEPSNEKPVSCIVDLQIGSQTVVVRTLKVDNLQFLFVEHPWFSERQGIYGDTSFQPYLDNAMRFTLLDKTALAYCMDTAWVPDIIHCHDWTSGFVPYLMKQDKSGFFDKTGSVITIHNLAYQGEFSRLDLLLLQIRSDERLFSGKGTYKKLNMLKTAVEYANTITTVSPTYAKEIQSQQYGCGLDELLRSRKNRIFGVLNGIDTHEWNPAEDMYLPYRFSEKDLRGKAETKRMVQQRFNLPVDEKACLIGIISRLAEQKGFFELIEGPDFALKHMLEDLPVQVLIIGTGDKRLEESLSEMAKAYKNLSFNMIFSNEAAHLVEAASDFFLMPSRYEPCGLNQMYSLAYGTIPIVRKTGGLADSVIDIDQHPKQGTGIVFDTLSGQAIYDSVKRAVQLYTDDPERMHELRKRGMAIDFSWNRSAREYEKIYNGSKKG